MFLPFKFYYYIIKNNPKKYKIAMNINSYMIIVSFPIGLMVLSVILSTLFLPLEFVSLNFIWIPIIINNFLFINNVVEQGYKIEIEEAEKRRQKERDEMERGVKEGIRRRRERMEQEIEWEKYWDSWKTRYKEARDGRRDQNIENAMKLLALKEGFTAKDVKIAYRKLAQIHHPDAGGTEENFKRLSKAYKYINNNL